MRKVEISSGVVSMMALLTAFCIFFLFVSASSASQEKIKATVKVGIGANVDCKPDYIDFKYSGNYINCYIEPSNFDMKKINPRSIILTVPGITGKVQANPYLQGYGDYDNDKIPDMKVYFISADVNKLIQTMRIPAKVTFNVSGTIYTGESFSGTDTVQVIRSALPFIIVLNVFAYIGGR